MQITLPGGPPPLRSSCPQQGARSAGFQPASGQDGRSPRKREGKRPEAGATGPAPGGSRHNAHHTSRRGDPQGRGGFLFAPTLTRNFV